MKNSLRLLGGFFWISFAIAAPPPIIVLEHYSYPMSPGQDEGVAYVTLQNTSSHTLTLLQLECDQGEAMIHQTIVQNGIAQMEMLSEITLPANGRLTMKPGERHIMIEEPRKPLQIGNNLTITFDFKGYDPLIVVVPVVKRFVQ